MKNVHILSTDKPSRLSILNSGKLNFGAEIMSSSNSKSQHIYITSDSDFKEGDWIYSPFQNKERVLKYNKFVIPFPKDKKIILTTNGDLIKDGVQEIDDDFLEWFIKNPSCEEVEVVDDLKYFNVDELRERHIKVLPYLYSERIGYKIIIPKKEREQETLEEAALRLYPEEWDWKEREIFIEGAKWQAERMYSEEEVLEIVSNCDGSISQAKKWLEQFKNKQNCLQIK